MAEQQKDMAKKIEKSAQEKTDNTVKKLKKRYKKWLMTDTGDYLKKKNMRKKEIARNRCHNMFEEKKTKRAYRKNKIRSMPQRKELQQQIENLTELPQNKKVIC